METFIKVNNVKVPYKIVDRRAGDLDTVFADPKKANEDLNWKTTKTLEDMVRDSWNFEKNNS